MCYFAKFCLFVLLVTPTISFCSSNSLNNYLPVCHTVTDSIQPAKDSLKSVDSSKNKIQTDTLKVINYPKTGGEQTVITADVFTRNDYRYAGDIFNKLPFYFLRNTGVFGQPDEALFYGAGFNHLSFSSDGLPLNNPVYNSYDLNNLREEGNYAIEISYMPKGFLAGIANNDVSINFLEKDFVTKAPYSRIKYFEGPLNEGYLDAIFNTLITKKLVLFVEANNKKMDRTFENNDYSIWNAKAQMKYFYSNRINILGGYSYYKSETGLFGGVNYDSVFAIPFVDPTTILYDRRLAPVVYKNRYQKESEQSAYLKLYSNNEELGQSFINFIYRSNNNEYSYYEDTTSSKPVNFKSERIFSSYLANVRQLLDIYNFRLDITGNYEILSISETSVNEKNYTNFSLAGNLSYALSPSFLTISAFGKTGKLYNTLLSGFGSDIVITPSKMWKFYFGLSIYEKYDNLSSSKQTMKSIQGTVSYSEEKTSAFVTIYHRNGGGEDNKYYQNMTSFQGGLSMPYYFLPEQKITGVSLSFDSKYKLIKLETATGFAQNYIEGTTDVAMPQIILNYGVFYENIHFDSSLAIKSGFNFKFSSGSSFSYYDIYNRRVFFYNSGDKTGNNYQLDFFTSGKIKEAVTISFVWENLLGRDYFLIPYYPMPQRGIRFGIMWEFLN